MAEPFWLPTTTSTAVPAAPAGVIRVRVVSSTTATPVAAAPSKVTVGVPAPLARKPVPVRVTPVPPREVPAAGARADRVGRAW